MSEDVQVHISEKPYVEGDNGPQVIFGFTHKSFSQAVFLDAPIEPAEAMRIADTMYEAFLKACGAAVKDWRARVDAGNE